ncbi:hypothetical protein EVAR_53746_1 [Eumeta japonica]|uniref:Uncharacterized protein n=1 Tax=Eumeta variegata TaxID=151549 RepID=A0A4C1ZDR0_EUMVA|nr:hypothetical protein EVAR_53746_1 [Eumeta japonica]
MVAKRVVTLHLMQEVLSSPEKTCTVKMDGGESEAKTKKNPTRKIELETKIRIKSMTGIEMKNSTHRNQNRERDRGRELKKNCDLFRSSPGSESKAEPRGKSRVSALPRTSFCCSWLATATMSRKAAALPSFTSYALAYVAAAPKGNKNLKFGKYVGKTFEHCPNSTLVSGLGAADTHATKTSSVSARSSGRLRCMVVMIVRASGEQQDVRGRADLVDDDGAVGGLLFIYTQISDFAR